MTRLLPLIPITLLLLLGCKQSNDANRHAEILAQQSMEPIQMEMQDGKSYAYFASGCFWCVEAIYEDIIGVEDVISGYSGGTTPNPTYNNHGDHAEAIEVIYDSVLIDFATLVDVYFASQNVTQINGQGPDRGTSYRSIIFYQNDEEKKIIENKIALLNLKLGKQSVAAQVLPFQKFYVAEEYHQDFERLNPNHPYIKNVSKPRKQKFEEKFPELLKKHQSD